MKVKYAVVFERMPNNYGAYVPDLPGCISTGKTWDEIQAMIQEAIALHVEGMQEHGEPLPQTPMSVEDATVFHNQPPTRREAEILAEYGDPAPVVSTTFEMVEVQVSPSPAGRAG